MMMTMMMMMMLLIQRYLQVVILQDYKNPP